MANILLLSTQKPDNTGSGVYLKEFARALAAQGHAVALVAGIAADDAFEFPASVAFYPVRFQTEALPFPVVGMSDEMPYLATRYRDLTPQMVEQLFAAFDAVLDPLIEDFQPDVVFSNHLYLLTAHLANEGIGVPIIGICHGSELRQIRKNPLEREQIRAGVRLLAGIMALHEAQKLDILREFEVPAGLVEVLGTGYNSQVFQLPKREAPAARGCTLVFAGKVTAAKGVNSLLRALELLDDPTSIRLTMAGGYSSRAEYDEVIERARAGSATVEFPGRLAQADLARAYQESAVFVLPSFYEGLPLVVIEALACGCKVVVSNLPGIRPWLEANLPGAPIWYVEPPAMRNVDEPEPEALPAFERRLAVALDKALASPSSACPTEHLSWETLAERALSLLPSA